MSGIVGMYTTAAERRWIGHCCRPSLIFFLTGGPDARDTWFNGAVGLGHTMLRTTRESQIERQPANLGGRFWITADAQDRLPRGTKREIRRAEGGKVSRRMATDSI